jgi:transposase-like protein
MMDKKHYRSYPEAFKLEALGVLQKGEKSAGQIERELGITPGMLVKWRARYQAVRKGRQAVYLEPSDLEAAKAEISVCDGAAETEEERDILKSRQHLHGEIHDLYHGCSCWRISGRAHVSGVGVDGGLLCLAIAHLATSRGG